MFLASNWFFRFGGVLAPDENAPTHATDEFGRGPLVSFVAPLPPESTANAASSPQPETLTSHESSDLILCEHCHQYTPVKTSGGHSYNESSLFASPDGSSFRVPVESPVASCQSRVAEACLHTAQLKSPPFKNKRKKAKEFFETFINIKFYNERQANSLREKLRRDTTLVESRTLNFGTTCPDGYTPLMAACFTNNLDAVKILLEDPCITQELREEQLLKTNLEGQMALHIASTQGDDTVINCLKQYQPLPSITSLDLLGYTPLGSMLTSPQPKAKTNQSALLRILFSPDDPSITGKIVPPRERFFRSDSLICAAAYADKPGLRVDMEDSIVLTMSKNRGVVGVMDGHDDGGACSRVVSQQVCERVMNMNVVTNEGLREIFANVDAHVLEQGVPGGSTAVVAVLTDTQIVVANVGDSRCILIRRGTRSLEAHLSKLSLADETTTEGINTSKSSDFFVKEMSYDHKPDVPGEKQRIEAAGLTVEETRFVENGEEHVIAKVVRETSKMSCSRSFGDREYKENEDLDAAHQAVTAVPGIIVHERTHQDAFLVLACDGIFDVMTNEEVGAFVATSVQEGLAKEEEYVLPKVADRLLRECLDRGSSDNMSCIIVALSDLADKVSPQQIIPKSLNFSPTESTPLPK